MLTIFQFFATKTDASALRMLNGSPADRLLKPITDYVQAKGGRIHLRHGCKWVARIFFDGLACAQLPDALVLCAVVALCQLAAGG
jgi:hypothetical protein